MGYRNEITGISRIINLPEHSSSPSSKFARIFLGFSFIEFDTTMAAIFYYLSMDDLRFRKIFNLGITKDISGKKLSKLEKLQSLVAKCCKIRKI